VITIHQRHRRTDGQTDRQTTCDRKTALCTIVHRAVKKSIMSYAVSYVSGQRADMPAGIDRSVTESRQRHRLRRSAARCCRRLPSLQRRWSSTSVHRGRRRSTATTEQRTTWPRGIGYRPTTGGSSDDCRITSYSG